jgi:hypothetical protein
MIKKKKENTHQELNLSLILRSKVYIKHNNQYVKLVYCLQKEIEDLKANWKQSTTLYQLSAP